MKKILSTLLFAGAFAFIGLVGAAHAQVGGGGGGPNGCDGCVPAPEYSVYAGYQASVPLGTHITNYNGTVLFDQWLYIPLNGSGPLKLPTIGDTLTSKGTSEPTDCKTGGCVVTDVLSNNSPYMYTIEYTYTSGPNEGGAGSFTVFGGEVQ